jgi:DNA-binding transcriptional LysR family regulator
MENKIQAHIQGLGVGFIPLYRAKPYLENGSLLTLQLDQPPTTSDLHLGWRTSNGGQALHWLLEQLRILEL